MHYVQEFRSKAITDALLAELKAAVDRPLRIMEVCGTHTASIFRHGLRSLLPPEVELISGPGCPVCVTPPDHIDIFLQAAQSKKVLVATFGDLMRVPGSGGSLADARSRGARVEIVYSPMDALALAEAHPDSTVFFPAIGFETTAPAIASTILEARSKGRNNFCIFAGCKVMPPPLELILADPELAIDGLLCPGHVSAIIGSNAFRPLARKYHIPCAVAGFEPADILAGLVCLARQVADGRADVDNCYTRAVTEGGNTKARNLMDRVFQPVDSHWRGLGMIPGSGLGLRDEFQDFDAVKKLQLSPKPTKEPLGCRCGEILRGHIGPAECALFAKVCTPAHPVGPCMVSSEGTCAAHFRYNGLQTGSSDRTTLRPDPV